MLSLESVITARVREALEPLPDAWHVIGFSTDDGQRDKFPMASVLFADARVTDNAIGAANVQAAWRVTLVARKKGGGAAQIDAAFHAVMAAVHDWPPGIVSSRTWNHLRLEQVAPPQYGDDGLVGLELTFTTHARYSGQP